MSNFDLANIALKSVCPNNEILYDDKGLPSVMVYIPKMTYAQLGLGTSTATHPAFIVDGQEVDGIYISKYQNVVQNGRAYSLPGQDPRANITFDAALSACTAKGAGWHLMTRAEWAMLALWCKKNGTQPNGNNNYGKDTSETVYKAIPTTKESNGNTNRVATGTGPLSWSHDGTPSGIWDLNGNCSEWVGGMRTVNGELQILANNNAADLENPQSAASAKWMAINASDGTLITPNGSGTTSGSIKVDWISSAWKYISGTITNQEDNYHGCTLESVTCDSSISAAAQLLLQALGLFKYDSTAGAYNGDNIYFNDGNAERMFNCGGSWAHGGNAGVFFCHGYNERTSSYGFISFRAAYVKLPSS